MLLGGTNRGGGTETVNVLELKDIRKSYPLPGGSGETAVLKGIDLSVAAGESLAVLGPSGSGKSTLLNIMGGLDAPSSGEIWFQGRRLDGIPDREIAALRNREIGFVFQLHHLLPQLSVLENVLLPTVPRAAIEPQNEPSSQRAFRLLNRVGLGERVHHRPGQLSGGECQRTALVRALINGPSLLLADEPTGSLDEEASRNLADLLLELNREEGATLVVVTHSQALAAGMRVRFRLASGTLIPVA